MANSSTPAIDICNQLYLNPSDASEITLITEQLTGSDNYGICSRAMLIALCAKNKQAFVNGKCHRPEAASSELPIWERFKAIVLSWIMNNVSKKIFGGIVYSTDATIVWNDMKERFDNNGSRIFSLHREIGRLNQALKLDHARVIDTSYIFKDANGPTRKKPSLSLLCKAKLDYDLRKPGNPHNCLDDACAAMKLVLARLEGRIDDVISQEVKELDAGKKELDAGRLFVHRIPGNVLGKDLQEVIPGDFTLQMKTNKNKNTCSAFAIFKSMEESNEAFENLEGDLQKDSSGRPQKLVRFKLGSGLSGSFCVCKTCHDDSVKQLKSNKRLKGDEVISGTSKKMRRDQTREPIQDTNQCEVHLEEIQRLKEELSHRDQDISNLNRIIAALTRKQGL